MRAGGADPYTTRLRLFLQALKSGFESSDGCPSLHEPQAGSGVQPLQISTDYRVWTAGPGIGRIEPLRCAPPGLGEQSERFSRLQIARG